MEENTFYHKYPGDIILTNQNYYYIRIYDIHNGHHNIHITYIHNDDQ